MRRHDVDVVALLAGLLFLALGAGWALDAGTDANLDGHWVVPVVLVGVGLIGLAGTLLGNRRERD